jgi:hypothetical protein
MTTEILRNIMYRTAEMAGGKSVQTQGGCQGQVTKPYDLRGKAMACTAQRCGLFACISLGQIVQAYEALLVTGEMLSISKHLQGI